VKDFKLLLKRQSVQKIMELQQDLAVINTIKLLPVEENALRILKVKALSH
jgi:hypothetical protein